LSAALIMLLSGLLHATVNAILKAGRDKMSGRALMDGFSALLVAPAALVVPLPEHAWGWLAASWFVHLLYLVALIRSFEQADLGVAFPIARGLAPVFAAAAAVLVFGEPISPAVALGIGLICSGVLAIGLGQARRGRVGASAVAWAALTGVFVAAYTVIDAQGVRAAPSAASYIVWVFLSLGGGIATFFALWRGRAFVRAAAAQWRPGLLAGALSICTYGLALFALRLGATPRLAALRETSILFASFLAVFVLKEKTSGPRLLGVLATALGAIVLVAGR
jgi:drug/metabolite transporter (DMT)-like permease